MQTLDLLNARVLKNTLLKFAEPPVVDTGLFADFTKRDGTVVQQRYRVGQQFGVTHGTKSEY